MFHPQTTIHYKRLFLFCFCQTDEKINTLKIWVITKYWKLESKSVMPINFYDPHNFTKLKQNRYLDCF